MELQDWTTLLQMVLHDEVLLLRSFKLKDDVEIIPQAMQVRTHKSRNNLQIIIKNNNRIKIKC
jgi:hypothetical protein